MIRRALVVAAALGGLAFALLAPVPGPTPPPDTRGVALLAPVSDPPHAAEDVSSCAARVVEAHARCAAHEETFAFPAVLDAAIAPAQAGVLLCPECVTFLKICCPKPCPKFDSSLVAKVVAKGQTLLEQLLVRKSKLAEASQQSRVIGPSGPRSSRVITWDEPTEHETRERAPGRIEAVGLAEPRRRFHDHSYALREGELDEAEASLLTFAKIVDAQSERTRQLLAQGAAGAPDLRAHVRLIPGFASVLERYDQVIVQARALTVRLEAARAMPTHPRYDDAPSS